MTKLTATLSADEEEEVVRLGLVGSLAVTVGGKPVGLGGAQARAVLAIPALANPRVVPVDELIEGVWGGSPP